MTADKLRSGQIERRSYSGDDSLINININYNDIIISHFQIWLSASLSFAISQNPWKPGIGTPKSTMSAPAKITVSSIKILTELRCSFTYI